MNAMLTKEHVEILYKPFNLKDHKIRQGFTNKPKTKMRWFVYVDKVPLQKRLDTAFVGQWELKMLDTRPLPSGGFMSTLSIEIMGQRRDGVGAQPGDDLKVPDQIAAAKTRAFRNAAYSWGLGFYLEDMPEIWTEAPPKGDWKAYDTAEANAKRQFADWFRKQFPGIDTEASEMPGSDTEDAPPDIDPDTGEITAPPKQAKSRKEANGQIVVTTAKYVNRKDGKGTGLIYEADDIEVLDFTRESLRKLGDEWQVTVDQWQADDKDDAKPIELIAPIRVTYENVFNRDGELAYRKAVTLETAVGAAERKVG